MEQPISHNERRYSIYFIPLAENEFYQTGTHIIGYDIRSQRLVSSGALAGLLPILRSGPFHFFGFHATIRGIFKTIQFTHLEEELASLARRTSPIPSGKSFPHSFSKSDRVILFDADKQAAEKLFELRSQIVSIVDKFRLRDYISPETQQMIHLLTNTEVNLLNLHGDPRVMKEYVFHFTLANMVSSEKLFLIDQYIEMVKSKLYGVNITIDRLCLVAQDGKDPYWKILKEYVFDGVSVSV